VGRRAFNGPAPAARPHRRLVETKNGSVSPTVHKLKVWYWYVFGLRGYLPEPDNADAVE
jgi:hypothetical protein